MAPRVRLTPADVRSIEQYNWAVFDAYVRRLRRLPRRAAFRRRGIGHESLFDTLVHILNVREVWLVYILKGRTTEKALTPLFEDPTRHPKDWAGFTAYATRVRAGVEATTRGLTNRALARRTGVFWMPGTHTVADAYLQTTFEQAHHLGEMIGALWQDDARPPEMTWMDWGFRLGRRRARGARRRR